MWYGGHLQDHKDGSAAAPKLPAFAQQPACWAMKKFGQVAEGGAVTTVTPTMLSFTADFGAL